MNHRSRNTTPFAIIVILVALTLLPHNAAATSPSQVDRIEELEARLAALESAAAGAPTVVTYQGYLTDAGGAPLDGLADLRFRIYTAESGGTMVWEETHTNVTVTNGYFTALLGSAGSSLDASVFSGTTRWMQVGVNTGSGYTDLPRHRIAAVPYALQAASAPWSGLTSIPAGFADGTDDGATYANVIVVAKSGGDYTSVQSAIDSISDASASNPYLVWIAPGVYNERVIMKPYVHVQGAGQEVTLITNDYYEGTLVLAGHTTLRDLTVSNTATIFYVIALSSTSVVGGTSDITEARVSNVTARAQASGVVNYAINIESIGANVVFENVTAIAENGSNANFGMYKAGSVTLTLHGSSFAGHGGSTNTGIYHANGITTLTHSIADGTINSVFQSSGTITVTHSRLMGGPVSGSVTCVAVSRGSTFNASGCP